MKAAEALIARTPATCEFGRYEATVGQVRVGALLKRTQDRDWTDPFLMTGGAAYRDRRKLEGLCAAALVFIDFHSIVVRDGIDPQVAHDAFLEIDEFRERMSPDICGATGDVREHALVFVHGPGGNGKSVFLNTVTGIMGDYAATAAMATFTASKGENHPTDVAMLRGARLVTASETEEGRAWAEAKIKAVTGGDPITARFMRQDFFIYKLQFKMPIVGNHKPVLQNVDEAARRRFNIVPFTLTPTSPDRELEAKLRNEWPAILRWAIDGCLDWQQNGLVRPATAQAWLAAQPQVKVVTRDRGGAYALAATRALPGVMQVADRWHLMQNASQAFLAATRSCMRQIRTALGATTVDPELLTAAEKLQYEGYLRREDVNAAVLELTKAGVAIKEIVRRTGHSRATVRRVLRGQRSPGSAERGERPDHSLQGPRRRVAGAPSAGREGSRRAERRA